MTARKLMIAGGRQPFVYVITSAARSPNLHSLAVAAGWDAIRPIKVIIDEGVDVADISLLSPQSSVFDGKLKIVNYGRIGGTQTSVGDLNQRYAFRTNLRISIENHGKIFGAGGSGGSGAGAVCYHGQVDPMYYISSVDGYGGLGQGFSNNSKLSGKKIDISNNTSGGYPAVKEYSGAVFGGAESAWCRGGFGGVGGLIGRSGGDGSNDVAYGGNYVSPSKIPARAGLRSIAVSGNEYIKWINYGEIIGEVE